MLYAGQELGEPATDAEGYSGMDGRTTIFDYWSVPTLRRWHQDKPMPDERRLRGIYRQLLRLCNSEKTLANGQFFDLMYANQDTLDTSRQYAYLRHCDGEMTLIVANFGDQEVNAAVRIPQHALDCSGLPQGQHTAKELFTGKEIDVNITCETLFPVHIQANSAVMWKIFK